MDKLEQYLENRKHIFRGGGMKGRKYNCPECQDVGWIIVRDAGREVARKCGCYVRSQSKKMMKRSGISEEFQDKGFQDFQDLNHPQLLRAKEKAVHFAENFYAIEHERRNSILFSGQAGAGKTHLGTAICGKLMQLGVAVAYMSYRESVTRLKQNIMNEPEYDRELLRYMRARVLYVDDLLKGRLTETDVNILYEIVNYRYMNYLPMIVSTEKNLEEILMFDEATGSRLIEMCRGNIVKLQGKELNYRLYSAH